MASATVTQSAPIPIPNTSLTPTTSNSPAEQNVSELRATTPPAVLQTPATPIKSKHARTFSGSLGPNGATGHKRTSSKELGLNFNHHQRTRSIDMRNQQPQSTPSPIAQQKRSRSPSPTGMADRGTPVSDYSSEDETESPNGLDTLITTKDNLIDDLSQDQLTRDESCRKTFELPPEEYVIDDFGCAFYSKIHLHGRLYITPNYVNFRSNVLGYITIVKIPFAEVTDIARRNSAMVVPNALEISTKKTVYFFTSFAYRDQTYKILRGLWLKSINHKYDAIFKEGDEEEETSSSHSPRSEGKEDNTVKLDAIEAHPEEDDESLVAKPLIEHHSLQIDTNDDPSPSILVVPSTPADKDNSEQPPGSFFSPVKALSQLEPVQAGTSQSPKASPMLGPKHARTTSYENTVNILEAIPQEESSAKIANVTPLQTQTKTKVKLPTETEMEVIDIFPIPVNVKMKPTVVGEKLPINVLELFNTWIAAPIFLQELHEKLGDKNVNIDHLHDFKMGIPSFRGVKFTVDGKKSAYGNVFNAKEVVILETQRLLLAQNNTRTMNYLIIHSSLSAHNLNPGDTFQIETKIIIKDTRNKNSIEKSCTIDSYIGVSCKSGFWTTFTENNAAKGEKARHTVFMDLLKEKVASFNVSKQPTPETLQDYVVLSPSTPKSGMTPSASSQELELADVPETSATRPITTLEITSPSAPGPSEQIFYESTSVASIHGTPVDKFVIPQAGEPSNVMPPLRTPSIELVIVVAIVQILIFICQSLLRFAPSPRALCTFFLLLGTTYICYLTYGMGTRLNTMNSDMQVGHTMLQDRMDLFTSLVDRSKTYQPSDSISYAQFMHAKMKDFGLKDYDYRKLSDSLELPYLLHILKERINE